MNQPPGEFWKGLQGRFPQDLVNGLHERFERGETFELSPEEFVAAINQSEEEGRKLLEFFADRGFLEKRQRYLCACDREEILTAEEAEQAVCARCGDAFKDKEKGGVTVVQTYFRKGIATRDVRWVLALHGMNTRGPWQEDFNWMLSRAYGHSVPVAIYKYGLVRPGAILRFRQGQLTKGLLQKIKQLSGESSGSGFGGVPDVIAHSFGTWLLGHALESDHDLRVGRIILVGCILRPDFNWRLFLERGQVDAVLCHYSTGDFWAGVAEYIIPDSGPSGRRGFNDRHTIAHVQTRNLPHSGYFAERKMPEFYKTVWRPFLTSPQPLSQKLTPTTFQIWRPTYWPFRATLPRYAILFLAAAISALVLLAFVLGVSQLVVLRLK